jgi:hypothetical protein
MTNFDSANWTARWEFIDDFIHQWLSTQYSREPVVNEIREAEENIGLQLPPSVRAWCEFVAASDQIEDSFNFRDEFVMEKVPGHSAISILQSGEQDLYWAIDETDWHREDPPVKIFCIDYSARPKEFKDEGLFSLTVSSFAMDYLFANLYPKGGSFSCSSSSMEMDWSDLVSKIGEASSFGHLEFAFGDRLMIYRSNMNQRWGGDSITVHVFEETDSKSLPDVVQELLPKAHVLAGKFAEQ